jgi:cation diffusion facilitator CzcD-associated flavoprotein CzcO
MKRPVRDLSARKIAVIGGGDTAAQVAEIMLGQGVTMPTSAPECIHWYGGENMPLTKQVWMRQIHARWAGIGRALPDQADELLYGVVRPLAVRAEVVSIGDAAMVNGQVYDMAVMCTGFEPAECRVTTSFQVVLGGVTVGRCTYEADPLKSRVFNVGTAAGINATYKPYTSRFPEAKQSIYNLAPRTAALAAALSADSTDSRER